MALALAKICHDMAALFGSGACEEILEMKGMDTAAQMEWLGDLLNAMDAVTEDDEWMEPVFRRAHVMFPASKAVA